MPKVKSFVLDATRKDDLLQAFPQLPLLSSEKLGWEAIHIHYHRQPAWDMPEHCPTQHVIAVQHQERKLERMLDGRKQSEWLTEGDILIIPANVPHRTISSGGEAHFTLLYLEPKHISAIAHEYVDSDRVELIPQFAMRDPLIYQICLALKSELESDGLGSRLYAESMATALWAHLLKKYATQPLRESTHRVGKNQLRPAIEFIKDNLAQDLKLAEIAAAVNMSQFYFARMFKQLMGISPHQYVVRLRMVRAQQLLCQSQLSVAEVALRVGFANQSHFTAQFRKATGTTPKSYRDSVSGAARF